MTAEKTAMPSAGASTAWGTAEQLAIAAGGLIVYAASARIDAALAARLTRLGQLAFGVCAVLFGGAHFFYMNLTAPLVPHGCRLRRNSEVMQPGSPTSRRALRS